MIGSPGTFLHGADDPWKTFGIEELCTWREPGQPGVAIFQTRRPEFAKKLSKRGNCRLFRSDCGGGYLRLFLEPMEPWQARRLVSRYLRTANEGFSRRAAAPVHVPNPGKVIAARKIRRRVVSKHKAKTHRAPNLGSLP